MRVNKLKIILTVGILVGANDKLNIFAEKPKNSVSAPDKKSDKKPKESKSDKEERQGDGQKRVYRIYNINNNWPRCVAAST